MVDFIFVHSSPAVGAGGEDCTDPAKPGGSVGLFGLETRGRVSPWSQKSASHNYISFSIIDIVVVMWAGHVLYGLP